MFPSLFLVTLFISALSNTLVASSPMESPRSQTPVNYDSATDDELAEISNSQNASPARTKRTSKLASASSLATGRTSQLGMFGSSYERLVLSARLFNIHDDGQQKNTPDSSADTTKATATESPSKRKHIEAAQASYPTPTTPSTTFVAATQSTHTSVFSPAYPTDCSSPAAFKQ